MSKGAARLVAGTTLALLVALPVADAGALTRKQAAKVALKALKPRGESAKYVVVFGLPRPLKPAQRVVESGSASSKEKEVVSVPPIGRKAWLFWEDLEYGAKFRHPSRLVLVDDDTGRVIRNQPMNHGWPLIDAKRPAFIKSRARSDKRYRIYTRLAPVTPPKASAMMTSWLAAAATSPFPPGTFKDDCLVTLVDREGFESDFQRVTQYFSGLGVRTFQVPRKDADTPPNGQDLRRFVKQLARVCKDIIIYTSGHNSTGNAVDVGQASYEVKGKTTKYTQKFTPLDVKGIIKDNPGTTFKLIVDSCNAAAFLTPEIKAGTLVAVAASADGQSSHTGVLFPGVPSNGSTFTHGLLAGMKLEEGYVAKDNSGASAAARLIHEGFGLAKDGLDPAALIGLTDPKSTTTLPEYGRPVTPLSPGPTPPPEQPPGEPAPTIKPIQAEFVDGTTFTQYQVTVDASSGRAIDYAWSLTPPPGDPTCNKLEQQAAPRYANWYHATADGCSHTGTQHDGVVKVVATVHWPEVPRDWVCTATYNGTLSGTGPQPEPCVAQ